MRNLQATLIISVYKNIGALRAILYALSEQSNPNFEIIISEDGNDPEMAKFISSTQTSQPLIHLTQEDRGFRKNKALNKAIAAANTNLLIFIDGDCVPHKHHIGSHILCAEHGAMCSGRRAELGPKLSRFITQKPDRIRYLESIITFGAMAIPAVFDHSKNYEAGLYSRLLHKLSRQKDTGILGCNFSCHKQDLIAVNGFNEEYISPAIGEDSDIEWRLRQNGVKVRNIKFLAPVYHLYHEHKFVASENNERLFKRTRDEHKIFCDNGVSQYMDQHSQ